MHLMIDLETMGLRVNAPVLQLGWAWYTLPGNRVIRSVGLHIFPGTRRIDWETVKWWLKRDEAARNGLVDAQRVPITTALAALTDEINSVEPLDGIWSHGASFDIAILEEAYREFEMPIPWGHRTPRDTRTMLWLAGLSSDSIKSEIKHSAVHDAVAQALAMQQAFDIIKSTKE